MNDREQREIDRRLDEREFDAMLLAYITDGDNAPEGKRFQFGGPLNLISTVRKLFEDMAEKGGSNDYLIVAEALKEVEDIADLRYAPPIVASDW